MAKKAFKNLNKKDFSNLLSINQLMVSKNYFLKNVNMFKYLFNGKNTDLINEKNTVFVSIPLIRIPNLKIINYNNMKKAFRMRFLDKLYALLYQKKIFSTYPHKLLCASFLGKIFILRYLLESIFNKENINKLKIV